VSFVCVYGIFTFFRVCIYGYMEEERWALHMGPKRSRGGKIHFSPPLPLSLAKDWATAGVQRYRDNGDGLGDWGVQWYSGWGDGWSDRDYIFGRHRGRLFRSYRILSYHLITLHNEIHTASFASSALTRSVRHFVDAHSVMDSHSRVVSYLLTLCLRSLSQNCSFSGIPLGLPWEVRRIVGNRLSVIQLCHFTTPCWLNHSGSIWRSNRILLLWAFSPNYWLHSGASQNWVQPFTHRLRMNAPRASCMTCAVHGMWFLDAGHSIPEVSTVDWSLPVIE